MAQHRRVTTKRVPLRDDTVFAFLYFYGTYQALSKADSPTASHTTYVGVRLSTPEIEVHLLIGNRPPFLFRRETNSGHV